MSSFLRLYGEFDAFSVVESVNLNFCDFYNKGETLEDGSIANESCLQVLASDFNDLHKQLVEAESFFDNNYSSIMDLIHQKKISNKFIEFCVPYEDYNSVLFPQSFLSKIMRFGLELAVTMY